MLCDTIKIFFGRGYWSGCVAAQVINEQFTRAYSRGRIFEPLAFVMDQDGATIASYRAPWCLAMEGLREWLQEERARLSVGTISAAAPAKGPAPASYFRVTKYSCCSYLKSPVQFPNVPG